MPENKFLWRATVQAVNQPIYLIAQNFQSAHSKLHADPMVNPEDITRILRVDAWDDQNNMTIVIWPEPPPEPEPEPEPPP